MVQPKTNVPISVAKNRVKKSKNKEQASSSLSTEKKKMKKKLIRQHLERNQEIHYQGEVNQQHKLIQ
jgi:hypothetical protein